MKTDAELAVERDALLESGRTEEEVARMHRADAMELELLYMLDREDGCLLATCGGPGCCRDGRVRALLGIKGSDFSEIHARIDALSRRENETATSAPHPAAEPEDDDAPDPRGEFVELGD